MKKILLLLLGVCLVSASATAQSLKDILKSQTVKDIVTSVTGGQKLTAENLQGTWVYQNPALQLKDENTFKNIAGSVATSEVEKKLKDYCEKVGIVEEEFNYVFNADGTFTSKLKRMNLKGTYTFDSEARTVSLKYSILGKSLLTLDADVILAGDQLTILFNADKLLDFLSAVSSISNITALQAVNKLASKYDGLKAGFDMKKQ